MRPANRRQSTIFRILRHDKGMSLDAIWAEVADRDGLESNSRSTVWREVQRMIEAGLVRHEPGRHWNYKRG